MVVVRINMVCFIENLLRHWSINTRTPFSLPFLPLFFLFLLASRVLLNQHCEEKLEEKNRRMDGRTADRMRERYGEGRDWRRLGQLDRQAQHMHIHTDTHTNRLSSLEEAFSTDFASFCISSFISIPFPVSFLPFFYSNFPELSWHDGERKRRRRGRKNRSQQLCSASQSVQFCLCLLMRCL